MSTMIQAVLLLLLMMKTMMQRMTSDDDDDIGDDVAVAGDEDKADPSGPSGRGSGGDVDATPPMPLCWCWAVPAAAAVGSGGGGVVHETKTTELMPMLPNLLTWVKKEVIAQGPGKQVSRHHRVCVVRPTRCSRLR